jgi:hypothetical protein
VVFHKNKESSIQIIGPLSSAKKPGFLSSEQAKMVVFRVLQANSIAFVSEKPGF